LSQAAFRNVATASLGEQLQGAHTNRRDRMAEPTDHLALSEILEFIQLREKSANVKFQVFGTCIPKTRGDNVGESLRWLPRMASRMELSPPDSSK
jgi:hypothetical protein